MEEDEEDEEQWILMEATGEKNIVIVRLVTGSRMM